MSKTWPAYEKWSYRKSTPKSYYLQDQITKGAQVTAYVDKEALPDFEGLTFDDTYAKQMKYGEFLLEMNNNANGAAMIFKDL